ncbi:hypothetical protein KSF78_0002323 [Schistosoma japonicum]|nr:hypothetical protein KSF78_0002323 [Schistosoma japonicum]
MCWQNILTHPLQRWHFSER